MSAPDGMRPYTVKGTWRQLGAIGEHQPFERGFYGFSPQKASDAFRSAFNAHRQDILIKSVTEAL